MAENLFAFDDFREPLARHFDVDVEMFGQPIQIALVDDDPRIAAAVRGTFGAVVGSHGDECTGSSAEWVVPGCRLSVFSCQCATTSNRQPITRATAHRAYHAAWTTPSPSFRRICSSMGISPRPNIRSSPRRDATGSAR